MRQTAAKHVLSAFHPSHHPEVKEHATNESRLIQTCCAIPPFLTLLKGQIHQPDFMVNALKESPPRSSPTERAARRSMPPCIC
jgi:hypothetical protein